MDYYIRKLKHIYQKPMKYEHVKTKGIYTTAIIDNETVVFEKKERTESSHHKIEAWFVDGLVNDEIKYVAIAEFDKYSGNFISLIEIEKY